MESIGSRFSHVVASGLRAQALAAETELGTRLPENLLETLKQDLINLSGLVPGTADAMTNVKTHTGKQQVACTRAFRRIAAIRRTVVRQTQNPDARRAYGVGERTNRKVVKDVVHSLRVIIARMEAQPEEMKSFGFVDGDLVTLRNLLTDVMSVDQVQEMARVERPNSTRLRDEAIRRVLRAVGIVSDIGAFQFADDDARREQFEALAPHAGGPRPSPPEPKKSAPEVAAEPK